MRILSRIGSWLRGGSTPDAVKESRPQAILDRGLDPSLAGRLPRVPVERFRAKLLEAIHEAHDFAGSGGNSATSSTPGAAQSNPSLIANSATARTVSAVANNERRERVILKSLDP